MANRVRFFLTLLCLSQFAFIPTLVSAGDTWPRFGGPNGIAVVRDTKLPVQWTDKNILWKVKVPGIGNSSPVVWKDRIFFQTATKDATARMLLCLDANNGKTLWKKGLSGGKALEMGKERRHKMNTYASSTPATDGERVYAAFWDGKHIHLQAYDFSGKKLWAHDLGEWKSEHGAGASPVVYGDLVYFSNHMDGKCTLYAFSAKTGDIAWEQARPAYRACYSAPFLWERDGKKEIVLTSSLFFNGYDPKTGKQQWSWKWQKKGGSALRVTGSAVFVDNVVCSYGGSGGGRRIAAAIKVSGKGPEATTGLVWKKKSLVPYVPTMIPYNGNFYCVHDRGYAGCFDAKTGREIWYHRVEGAKFTSSPVLVGGKMYAPTEQGEVCVFEIGPNFNILARNQLGERFRASPAVANNRMYLRGRDHLFCIGTK